MSSKPKKATGSRTGVPVQAVIEALLSGKACTEQKKRAEDSPGNDIIVSILKNSETICSCAQSGMAWSEKGDDMRLEMSFPSLRNLCKIRGIDPTSERFQSGNGPRFQYAPNGTAPNGIKGVHVATIAKIDLATMLSTVISDRLGVSVTVNAEDISKLCDLIDDLAA